MYAMRSAICIGLILIVGCQMGNDPERALKEARRYTEQGQYEKALQEYTWFYRHALDYGSSYAGVRSSFVLQEWSDLGAKYPKALDAMRETRDGLAHKIENNEARTDTFDDLVSLNYYLHDPENTTKIFKGSAKSDPTLAAADYA